MDKLFGTDGMRGPAGEYPLDAATIEVVGGSLARQFREKTGRVPRFVSGRDTRESGSWIELAFHKGACAEGAECLSAGVITTPGVALVTKQFEFDAGIVISASHNPFHDNGIKIFAPDGKKIDSETERAIEADILNKVESSRPDFSMTEIDVTRSGEYRDAYLAYLSEEFSDLKLENFKMVIDCANGAASELAPQLFASFGADVVVINCAPDGVNINKDCGSLHLELVQAKVIEEKADFGVAFDGDADRSLFVDEKGNLVDGDAVLWIMAQFLAEHGRLVNGTVVATVMSNIGLELALNSRNIKLIRASVGDKYVLEELLKNGAAVGGEQSGHIIFPQKSYVGDGMKTTLYLLESLYEHRKSLSAMTAGFTQFPQILINVKVREKRPFEQVEEIAAAAKLLDAELAGNGRLLLRYSGTENLARVMIEGEDQMKIEEQARRLADVIEGALS